MTVESRPVHVVVVAFHAAGLLERCLSHLEGRLAVTVVDNSSDPAVRDVAARHGATYLDSGANLGFGAGANIALRRLIPGPPCDVLLLNPDAEITPTQVDALSRHLHAPGKNRIGAVSPRLVGSTGEEQRVQWPFPHPGRAWLEAVGLGRLNKAPDYAVGACLLLRWEAVRDVGLFDERFFLYAEETDWQRRAHDLGWRPDLAFDVSCRHVGAATSEDSGRREAYFHAGGETYVRKWFGPMGWTVYRLAVLAGALARATVTTGPDRARSWNRVRLYAIGPRRAAGLS